jgi:hypothetical protein
MKTILLLLLSGSLAFGEPGDAEWKEALRQSWKDVFESYSSISKAECVEIVRILDKAAKKANHQAYYSPNKPMIYMRWEMKTREAEWAAWRADAPNRERRRIEDEERNKREAARINAEINSYGKPKPRDPVRDLRNDIEDLEQRQKQLEWEAWQRQLGH